MGNRTRKPAAKALQAASGGSEGVASTTVDATAATGQAEAAPGALPVSDATHTDGPLDGVVTHPVEAPQAAGPEASATDSAGSAAGAVTSSASADAGDQGNPQQGSPIVSIRALASSGRWRIGRHFTAEPTVILEADLSEDELERLHADPLLEVTEAFAPAEPEA